VRLSRRTPGLAGLSGPTACAPHPATDGQTVVNAVEVHLDAAPRCFYNGRHPVTEPGKLRGLKMRAPRPDIFRDSIRSKGANATPLTFGAVFSSLWLPSLLK
jgi:hypothetical protein